MVQNKYLELGAKYILQQQKIDGHLHEGTNIDSLSPKEIESIDAECEQRARRIACFQLCVNIGMDIWVGES